MYCEDIYRSGLACRRLWAAVLEQAIKDARDETSKPLRFERPDGQSAQHWFGSENDGIGSFLWICEMLDLEPRFVRTLVHSGQDPQVIPRITTSPQEEAYLC
jgi:hypothetical protein